MFNNLSDRLTSTFRNLRTRGRQSEADVDATVHEIRRALLDADVSVPVVRQFTSAVREHALGAEVVTHVGIAEPGRDADCAAGGGEQRGLGHAPAVAEVQHRARTHAVWREVDAVRIVAELVAHRVVERDRTGACGSSVWTRNFGKGF